MKYIVLRDDDTNYYTSIDELKNGYGDFWGVLPITLATIPYEHESETKIMDFDTDPNKFELLDKWECNASAKELSFYHQIHPVGINTKLVEELKKLIGAGKIEIAQHGVTHKYDVLGAEMVRGKVTKLDISSGKRYLEKVFETSVNVFIPPSNTIDDYCARSVDEIGLNIICSSSIKHFTKSEELLSWLTDPRYVMEKVSRKIVNNKPPMHLRRNIPIAFTHTFGLNTAVKPFCKTVNDNLSKYGFVGVGTHYRLLQNDDYRKKYHNVIDNLSRQNDVKFVTASEYFKRLREKIYE